MTDINSELIEKAAQALHDMRSRRSMAFHEEGQPLGDTVYDDERRADARAALFAVAADIRAEGAARALRDYADQLDQEAAEYAARLRVTHVVCRHCHLRYGERDQYPCVIAGTAHHYDEDELAEAAQVHVETTHDGDYARAHAIRIEARDE